MEWCKLYANLDSNPRVQAAEETAENSAWLLVQSMMYCTTAESQGFIPRTQVPRFGGRNTELRTKALVSEQLWIPEERGYRLDPDIWSEERNLSDAAERKKERDRERMRAIRAAAKQAAEPDDTSDDLSRDKSSDSRATGRATVAAQRREEKKNYPPNPPHSGGNDSRCTRHRRKRAGCPDCDLPPLTPVPEWCGQCSPNRRVVEPDGQGRDLGPCPTCHPSVVRTA